MPSLFYIVSLSLILKLCDDSARKDAHLLTNIDVKFLNKKIISQLNSKVYKNNTL